MKRKTKLKWHRESNSHFKATLGQSKLTLSVMRVPNTKLWYVHCVFGRSASPTTKYLVPENAMVEAERLAKKYTRQLINFWTT